MAEHRHEYTAACEHHDELCALIHQQNERLFTLEILAGMNIMEENETQDQLEELEEKIDDLDDKNEDEEGEEEEEKEEEEKKEDDKEVEEIEVPAGDKPAEKREHHETHTRRREHFLD